MPEPLIHGVDRCGQFPAGLVRRAVCAGEELERSQQSIGPWNPFNCSDLVIAMVFDPNQTLLDVAAVLVRCQVFRRSRGWFRHWPLAQFQKVAA